MAMKAVMNWFGKPPALAERVPRIAPRVEPVVQPAQAPAPGAPVRRPLWTPQRLAATDALWGDGYQLPGGEIETLRLAKPLGLSAASTMLLLGAGTGGAACSVSVKLGAWVSGFEADPSLAAAATDRVARLNLTKRVQIESWDPVEPVFRQHFYNHGHALEPLRGAAPELVLAALSTGLKANAQFSMTELVADVPLERTDPEVAAWAAVECRDPSGVPTETAITRILSRLGFDVRIVEDVSQRNMEQALTGWRIAVKVMEDDRPNASKAMGFVLEAELWLHRVRLMQLGRLRLVRWHAIGGGR